MLLIFCHLALTHWGRVTHICVSELTIIGSDNGLSPGRRQAIIWTNDGILLIRPLRTNFSNFFFRNSNIFIQQNALENVVCEMASILSRPQCVKIFTLYRFDWQWSAIRYEWEYYEMRSGFVRMYTGEHNQARFDTRWHPCLIDGFLYIFNVSNFWKFLWYRFLNNLCMDNQYRSHTKCILWDYRQM